MSTLAEIKTNLDTMVEKLVGLGTEVSGIQANMGTVSTKLAEIGELVTQLKAGQVDQAQIDAIGVAVETASAAVASVDVALDSVTEAANSLGTKEDEIKG